MRQTQRIVVYGDPRGKGRPRFAYAGHTYTDAVTVSYEGKVKKEWKCENNFTFGKYPTTISIKAFFRVPVSLSKKKREALFGTQHTKKPDADNIAKIILDACSDLWEDDSQVDTLIVRKRYIANDDEKPRVEVEIFGDE